MFALKAALVPVGFWLPPAYGSASAPVAALFAIMTKVGVYAILRVHGLVFGPDAGPAASLVLPWLLPVGLATVAVATLGVLASRELQRLLAHLVVLSAGTLVAALGLGSEAAVSAALYYALNSTLVGGGLFLLAGLIARERGDAGGRLDEARNLVAARAARGPVLRSAPWALPGCRRWRASRPRSTSCRAPSPIRRRPGSSG